MDLYICEKPSQAKDLALALKVKKRCDGYIESDGGDVVVTWAYGHLLEMFMPEDYSRDLKSWSLDTLPIMPDEWQYKVKSTASKQYKIVNGLIKKASTVLIACDLDREGESIARSLLDRAKYKGKVKRVRLTALDETSIKKALSDIRSGSETLPLYYAAMSRQRADWLIGMNASRLYSILARQAGYNQTIHIGRVITPTVTLVCQRDKEIKEFTPSPYWTLKFVVSVQNGQFLADWVPDETCCDDKGHCINKAFAEQVANQVQGSSAVITKAEKKQGKESPPLPFDLTSLQQYSSKRWGYTAQEVLDAAQSLYENKKAISYPRTDSKFLPESQLGDAPVILQSLILSDQSVSGLVAGANSNNKSRAFNDKKVTAHHAIIPTPSKTDVSKMSEMEMNIYDAVRRFYIAQFYNDFLFYKTNIEVSCEDHLFVASGKTPVKQGWKVIFGSEKESSPKDDGEEDECEENTKLPKVNHGEPALMQTPKLEGKMTRPPSHFTESSLLSAMENVARFVTEEKFRKILKDTAGLGTPATRAGIIQGAVDKGYFKREKKALLSTEKANSVIDILPSALKSPGMTAAWEQELEKIASEEGDMDVFMNQITNWTNKLVVQLKSKSDSLTKDGGGLSKAFESVKPPTFECFNCGGEIRRIKGSRGFFWGCRNESCKKTFDDNRGKPVDPKKSEQKAKNAPACPKCDAHMVKRKGKPKDDKKASYFWGCSNYPKCTGTKPVTPKKIKNRTE